MKNFLTLGLVIVSHLIYGQPITTFDSLLLEVKNSSKAKNDHIVERYIRQNGQTPIVQKNSVIFLAKSSAAYNPELISDFNGFMNPRYVKDSTLSKMTPIPKTTWFYRLEELQQDAMVNYQFLYGKEKRNDPLNPNLRINFGSPISFVQMPQYELFKEGMRDFSSAKGRLIKEGLESKLLNHERTIHIYLPAEYDTNKTYPSVFFHDGSFIIREAIVTGLLDNLISTGQIKPVVAIFDDPVIRGKEYRNDPDFRKYIQSELLPYINKKFNTSTDSKDRAVIGFSRGGMSSLYLSHSLEEFSMCGALSPAIHPKKIHEFTAELKAFTNDPTKVFITRSIYDKIWQQDASDLRTYFEQGQMHLKYLEINQGHNIGAWRTIMDDMLISFFPGN